MFERGNRFIIGGQEYVYWEVASKHRGTHYLYIDVDTRELTHAEMRKYSQMRYYYIQALNHPYFEVPEYELHPRTNRQAVGFLSKEE